MGIIGFIKKWSERAVHQVKLLSNILNNRYLGRRTLYAYYYKYVPVSRKTVLYEAFSGRGMLCNPYAIFLELFHNPKYSRYRHVWVLDQLENHAELIQEYRKYRNVKFVEYQSKHYLKYLCKAGYVINNSTFPTYYTKKEKQIYLNTWHGIPLKTLGYDMPNGKIEVANTVRNMLTSDYMISANPFLTSIYLESYKLHQIYEGGIIEEGYPRLDILKRFTREQIVDKLRRCGMEVDGNKSIILYAPTWKGATFGNPNVGVDEYYEFKDKLERNIDTTKYQIFVKVHQQVYKHIKDKLIGGWVVPATIDANEILSVTDILISDFSSIFYDFLATRRPILFYMPDIESYKKQRGMYMTPDELPGPYTNNIDELSKWICGIDEVAQRYKDKIEEHAKWADAIHDENISKKIVDIVFEKNEKDYAVHREKASKKKMLISRGGMRVNGISTSLVNLLNNIDYDKFDVTLMFTDAKNKNEMELVDRVNANVRLLWRNATFNMTFLEQVRHRYYTKYGIKNPYQEIYKREVNRSYGAAIFDYVIDFDGYNLLYSLLALNTECAFKATWLHNDMMCEKELRFEWLTNIFDIYQYFDTIISCSREIMEVNRDKLGGTYCDREKFGYAKNSVDFMRVMEGASQGRKTVFKNQEYCLIELGEDGSYAMSSLIPLQPWIIDSDTLSLDEKEYISQNVSYQKNGIVEAGLCPRKAIKAEVRRFCTVGRISPEKNHEALIRAFKKITQDEPGYMLYIIGDGPLREKMQELVDSLYLTRNVILTGNLNNPFALLKYCDCFILPSLHEGQPMVLHEARVLHMPIIMSKFSSAKGSMIEDGQLVIGTSEDDIYDGLKAYIEGKVPTDYEFDVDQYNKEAYQEFLVALGMDGVNPVRNS